jgi:hypothetical protein
MPIRMYVWAMTGTSVVYFVATFITQFVHCLPLERNWQILPDPGKECLAGVIINTVIAVGNVWVDELLLVVATLMLKDARIPTWRKMRIGYDYGYYAVHPLDQKFGAGSSGVHMGATRNCK